MRTLSDNPCWVGLVHSAEYNFALRFLQSVESFHDEALPREVQFLSILERLPSYPKKVIKASLPDTIKTILKRTQDWDVMRVDAADATLASLGCLTLSEMRKR